jgi:8-oxo-dGTP diphosphatase
MAAREPPAVPVEVAAALIQDEAGRYLITRRRAGAHLAGLWEFPGGKREAGETLEECLTRELTEELGADVIVGERVETLTWCYPERTVVISFFRCRLVSGGVEPRERQSCAWVEPARLSDYEFPPADRALLARLRA